MSDDPAQESPAPTVDTFSSAIVSTGECIVTSRKILEDEAAESKET